MIDGQQGAVYRQMHRLFDVGTTSGATEGQLLDRFVTRRDEAAFEALVARHGPMVLGICRRMLQNPRDVEDAFQATFLVLVRRAASIRDRELLGNWLYGVARRVSVRSRSKRAKLPYGAELSQLEDDCAAWDQDGFELRSVLDEELAKLPEKYRRPIVLCYLEGHTHEEAASRLEWPIGTVRGRLARARDLLRGRLLRRGIAPGSAVLTAALTFDAKACVPDPLFSRTVDAAMSSAVGRGAVAGTVSAAAVALADGVLRTLTMSKLKMIAAGLLATGALAGGSVAVALQGTDAPTPSFVVAQNRTAPVALPAQPSAGLPTRTPPLGTIPTPAGLPPAAGIRDTGAPQPSPASRPPASQPPQVPPQQPVPQPPSRKIDELLNETRGKVSRAIRELTAEVETLTSRLGEARADLDRYRQLEAALNVPRAETPVPGSGAVFPGDADPFHSGADPSLPQPIAADVGTENAPGLNPVPAPQPGTPLDAPAPAPGNPPPGQPLPAPAGEPRPLDAQPANPGLPPSPAPANQPLPSSAVPSALPPPVAIPAPSAPAPTGAPSPRFDSDVPATTLVPSATVVPSPGQPDQVVPASSTPNVALNPGVPAQVDAPHRITVGDVLAIEVLEALPGRPLKGSRPVRSDGTVSLDFYGDLKVTGLTRREAKIKLVQHMRKYVTDEALGLVVQDADSDRAVAIDPADSDRVYVDDSPRTSNANEQRLERLEQQMEQLINELRSRKKADPQT